MQKVDYQKLLRLAGKRQMPLSRLAQEAGYKSASSIYNLRDRKLKSWVVLARVAAVLEVDPEELLAKGRRAA